MPKRTRHRRFLKLVLILGLVGRFWGLVLILGPLLERCRHRMRLAPSLKGVNPSQSSRPGHGLRSGPLRSRLPISIQRAAHPCGDRLGKARDALASSMGKALGRSSISEETWDEFIEALIQADVGVSASMELVDAARERARAERLSTPAEAVAALRGEICERLRGDRSLSKGSNGDAPSVWLFLGVNGAGKTTTIGKLAMREISSGDRVMLAAGDTFRAAAAEQLDSWATRSGAEIIRGATGADPASVVYDAVESAAAKEIGLVIADTAGRLHTDRNLMDELRKIERVAGRGAGEVTEALLVLDASTGQNGLAQARQFAEAVNLTGVVLTKLDGSARGGIVLAVQDELGIPVKLVGVGEGVADLVTFDEEEFASALLG